LKKTVLSLLNAHSSIAIPTTGLITYSSAIRLPACRHGESILWRAFAFRTLDEKLDFVLISLHLEPNGGASHKARRKHELSAIANWIDDNDDEEKDFIILGDMNIEDEDELVDATPSGYLSLNDECRITNTNINGPKPYDHVMYNTTFTTEIDTEFDLKVINLIGLMEPLWLLTDVNYHGNPYNHNLFKQYYSDHHPVVFVMKVPDEDDD